MSTAIVGILMMLVAGLLIARHRRVWRQSRLDDLSNEAHVFARRQFGRRLQSSLLVGLIGAAMLASPLVTNPWVAIGYWGVVMLLLGWVMVLAVADVASTQQHFRHLQEEVLLERAALEAELRKLENQRSDGHEEA